MRVHSLAHSLALLLTHTLPTPLALPCANTLAHSLAHPLVDIRRTQVTVTGWLALACIISLVVVTVGGAFLLVRRFTGAAKPHTLHVKSGDA